MAWAVNESWYFDAERWAVRATGMAVGADTHITLTQDALFAAQPYCEMVVIDGASVRVGIAGGATYDWFIAQNQLGDDGSGVQIVHMLDSHQGGGATEHAQLLYPLGIWTTLKTNMGLIGITGTLVLMDDARFTLWGHYIKPKAIAEPQEVTVKGVEFFKKAPARGPV